MACGMIVGMDQVPSPDDPQPGTAGGAGWRMAMLHRLFAAILLAAVIMVPAAGVIWLRASEPSDRTLILPASSDWSAQGVRLAHVAGPSPLRQGDTVLAVDAVRLADWVAGRAQRHLRGGDQVRYLLRRDGKELEADVLVGHYPFLRTLAANAVMLPFILIFWIVAGVVFMRRPHAPTGRALLTLAGLAVAGRTTWPFGLQVLDLVGGRGVWTYLLGDVANLLVWAVLLHFALVLPEGRPLLRARPRRIVAAVYLFPLLLYGGWAVHTLLAASSPLARLGGLVAVSTPTAAVYPALTVIALTAGWQRVADPVHRARLRWVVSGLTVSAVLYLGLGQIPNLVAGGPLVPWEWQLLGFLVTPLAISWAIVRYQLFDIETVLRRSVVYAVLTLAVFGAYLLVFRLLVGGLPEQQQWVALFSSALLVTLFTTVRDRLRQFISRSLFGLRDDPAAVAAALRQVEPTGTPSIVLERVVATLANTLRLSFAAVELADPDGHFQPVASVGQLAPAVSEVPINRGDAVVGRLLMAPGAHREPFGPADRQLLAEAGQLVSSFATSALLAEELLRARRQLIIAQADERRRIRRDLHDRIGPRLAGIAMKLEAARSAVRDDPDRVAELLVAEAAGARSVAEEVNQAVDDLRPRVLDQRGLYRALQTLTSSVHSTGSGQPRGLPVTVQADGELGDLPAAIDGAAFYIAIEAVNNVAKHARASTCMIRLERGHDPDELRVEVCDDGCGIPAHHLPGVGLRSMRVRAEELGGSLTITARIPAGTVIRAQLPIDEP